MSMADTNHSQSHFNPARFHYSKMEACAEDDNIAVDEVITFRPPKHGAFCRIPLGAMEFYPPDARILNMLVYLNTMKAPDKAGGWYRITAGRSMEFLLQDKDARRRGLAALEARGVIEVERQKGKSCYARFTQAASAAFDMRKPSQ
jgi:hypothetical protein